MTSTKASLVAEVTFPEKLFGGCYGNLHQQKMFDFQVSVNM